VAPTCASPCAVTVNLPTGPAASRALAREPYRQVLRLSVTLSASFLSGISEGSAEPTRAKRPLLLAGLLDRGGQTSVAFVPPNQGTNERGWAMTDAIVNRGTR